MTEHGFVLLRGEPACGKSTIAAALAVGALDNWGCSTIKVLDADDFKRHWNPNEPKQFFWVDDAFGATQFDWACASAWNRVFPHIHAAIRKGARVLFTSRDYIYKSARNHLKESALPIMKESQVVIQVENLTKEEREQILYNHIRLGTQPQTFKSKIKQYLPNVSLHKRFSPETARRLGNPVFTKNLVISSDGLDDFVSNPLELLCEIIRTIDYESRAALALLFIRGGTLPSPISTTREEQHAISLLGATDSGVINALNALKGSFIIEVLQDGNHMWRFKHPTIRDAFATHIGDNRELIDIYLAGTPIEKLMQEVSCGNLGIEGVKVIIPTDRYDILMSRLESYDISVWKNKNTLYQFLAHRCDKLFLEGYINRYPTFISSLRAGSYLYAVADVDVLVRLHEFELLPEQDRLRAVRTIRDLAIETPDDGFLREDIRMLLTQNEIDEILEHVRTNLLPNLDEQIDTWRFNYNNDIDPDNYFFDLVLTLEEYREALAQYPDAVENIDFALSNIKDTVSELRSDYSDNTEDDESFNPTSYGMGKNSSRSIFEDIDQ